MTPKSSSFDEHEHKWSMHGSPCVPESTWKDGRGCSFCALGHEADEVWHTWTTSDHHPQTKKYVAVVFKDSTVHGSELQWIWKTGTAGFFFNLVPLTIYCTGLCTYASVPRQRAKQSWIIRPLVLVFCEFLSFQVEKCYTINPNNVICPLLWKDIFLLFFSKLLTMFWKWYKHHYSLKPPPLTEAGWITLLCCNMTRKKGSQKSDVFVYFEFIQWRVTMPAASPWQTCNLQLVTHTYTHTHKHSKREREKTQNMQQ